MEVASRSAQLLTGIMEAPPGDARAAERQPVFEEEGAGAGGGDALLALNSIVPLSFSSLVFHHLPLPPPTPFLLLEPLFCQDQRVRRWGNGAKDKSHSSVPPSQN